jgi:hypothetical protein
MQPYRFYLLDVQFRIAKAIVIECADDDEARWRGWKILAASDGHRAVEVWDRARRVYRHPAGCAASSADDRERAIASCEELVDP